VILQDSPAGCGPASLCNALEAAGVRVPQEMAAKLSGCNGTHGTSERGLIRAIGTLGHRAIQLREADPGVALMTLRGYLLHGVPLIVLVDAAAHWATVAGTLGPRICLVDSADGGVLSCLEPDQFMSRWECAGEKKPYYAIALIARKVQ
jgi:hypothetical protein